LAKPKQAFGLAELSFGLAELSFDNSQYTVSFHIAPIYEYIRS